MLRQVKRKALEQNKTLTAAVSDALSAWVQRGVPKSKKSGRIRIPTSGKGGVAPGVDLDSNASLFDRMDGLT